MLNLDGGDPWRRIVTDTLQHKAIKMLLCCSERIHSKDGVQEEVAIAKDLEKELPDPKFIIPLRLEPFKKLFGIGGLQYIDFHCRWAQGLDELLKTLERRRVPKSAGASKINPNWELYRKRQSISVDQIEEELTSNWLLIEEMPKSIRYFEPTGAVSSMAMEAACNEYKYPAEVRGHGFFSFVRSKELVDGLGAVGRFRVDREIDLKYFLEYGCEVPEVEPDEARKMLVSMFRQAWEGYCLGRGFNQYTYATQTGFHVSQDQLPLGKMIPWTSGARRRRTVLRNIAAGKIWSYGVSSIPQLWPFPHFKLKARVLFATVGAGNEPGSVIADPRKQHQARRTICKGWRNPRWHGLLVAYLKLLRGEEAKALRIPLSEFEGLRLEAEPIQFVSPVSTKTVREIAEDGEETDLSTLGTAFIEVDPE